MATNPLQRILIVEDEPDIQAIAKLALEAVGGFTVQVCSSGSEALKIAPQFAPDLILLDVMMPGMNGLMALQALRAIPETQTTPVIFITAKVQPQEVAQYRDLGALDVIPKPFDPMTLASTISASWERRTSSSLLQTHDHLDHLRTRYISRIQEKLHQIDTLWLELSRRQWNNETAQTLRRLAHNLVGSGATFGLPIISDLARNLEWSVSEQLKLGFPPTTEQQRQIEQSISQLKSAYENIRRGSSGSTFNQALALEQANLAPSPPMIERQRASQNKINNRLIYLLTDNTERAQDLALQVSYFGYTANIVVDIKHLSQAIQHAFPAAIVIDSSLLQHGGAEMLMKIRTNQPAPPIFFISSQDDISTRLQAVQAGGEAYFTIPVNISSLIDKLDSLSSHHEIEPYRILVVDDETELAHYYAHTLEQAGMLTEVVNNPLQIMHTLVDFMPDLILMDMYMPNCSGLQLAAVIRQLESFVSTPIVFLSMEDNLDRQLEAIRIGGDDFLTKPIQPAQLVSAVNSRVKRSRVLRSLMVRDSLTGLLKHTVLKDRLHLEIARAQRQASKLTFVMIDIDRFKTINDTYGHATGDRVIKSLSRLLQQRLRKTDVIGRYGGEEFALILPDTDGETALWVLDELRKGFAHIRQQASEAAFFATFSGGIAEFPAYSTADQIIDAADRALYEAKHAGRNQIKLSKGEQTLERS
jgi:diguanylate cyclase (GGDEF)-like protein